MVRNLKIRFSVSIYIYNLPESNSKVSFYVKNTNFRMEQVIINDLKVRSGKSIKFNIEDLQEVNVEGQVLNIVFLVNLSAKIALVLQNADVLFYKIAVKKSYFVQNLEHVETKQGIPVFKIPSPAKTILKPSKKEVPKTVKFSKEESNIASLIDMKQFLLDMPPMNAPKIESEPDKGLLSLYEFLEKKPKDIKSTTSVEVNFILCLMLYEKFFYKRCFIGIL